MRLLPQALQDWGTCSSTLSQCSVGINSLSRLTCPACPPSFLPVEVLSVFGGVCSGRSLEVGIDESLEFVANCCRRSLFSFCSSATRLSLISNHASSELSRARSCVTKARTAGFISSRSSGGISCNCDIAVVSQIPRISQRAVFEL